MDIDKIAGALSQITAVYRNEFDLQKAVGEVLAKFGSVQREVSRPCAAGAHFGRDRFDFFVDGHLVVEVKIDGSLSALTRQIVRYLAHADVKGVIVITSKSSHLGLLRDINGKPVRVAHLVVGAL